MKIQNAPRTQATAAVADLAIQGIGARVGDPVATDSHTSHDIRRLGYVGIHPDTDLSPAQAVLDVADEKTLARIMRTPSVHDDYDEFTNTIYEIEDGPKGDYVATPLVLQIRALVAAA